jgi:lipid-A-disaccharide synthase
MRHVADLFYTAADLGRPFQYLVPIAKTMSERFVNARFNGVPFDEGPEVAPEKFFYVDDAREALVHSRAAVVASGTATVEAALAGTPFVVVYRLSELTWKLGRRMVKLNHFAMPNLIAGREVVPELIQDDFTAENVVAELRKIIPDGPERERMLAGLAEVRAKLKPSDIPPAQRAAHVLLDVIR